MGAVAGARDEARNEQEHLHWLEAERIFNSTATNAALARAPARIRASTDTCANELRMIETKLEEISYLYSVVNVMLQHQSGKLDVLERNVDSISIRIDASEAELSDAAPRQYRTNRWRWYWMCTPNSLSARLRCALCALLVANVVFVIVVVL